MPLYGRRDGEREDIQIPRAALAGLSLHYGADGARLLDGFSRLRVPVQEIKTRWPVVAEDSMSAPKQASRQQAAIAVLNKLTLAGHPPEWIWGLKVFCDRLEAGPVEPERLGEAKVISELLVSQEGRPSTSVKSVAEWIGSYHRKVPIPDQPDIRRPGAADPRCCSGIA
jgi:hypothetical protein